MLFFFCLLLFVLLIQESFQVMLRHLQFLILFPNHSILGICFFLFLKKLRIFLIEIFDFWNATFQLTKCFFCSFVKKDFLTMCFKGFLSAPKRPCLQKPILIPNQKNNTTLGIKYILIMPQTKNP